MKASQTKGKKISIVTGDQVELMWEYAGLCHLRGEMWTPVSEHSP